MDIVSAVTRTGYNPWTNYLRFILAYAGTIAVFYMTYRRGASFLSPLWTLLRRFSAFRGITAGRLVLWIILPVIIGVVTINRTATDVTTPMVDTFHEGEYVGNVPAIQFGNSFDRIFLIHGGMDLLPGWLAERFSKRDRRIIHMRLITVALHAFAFLTALFVVYLAAKPHIPGRSRMEAVFLVLVSFIGITELLGYDAYTLVSPIAGGQQPFSVRDVAFLLQLALLFGFIQLAREGRSWSVLLVISLLEGASLSLSFLYSYERALYSAATILIITPAIVTQSRKISISWLTGLSLGGFLGLAGMFLIAGPTGVRDILEQIAYWGKASRFISSLPLTLRSFSMQGFFLLGLAVLVQCGGVVFLVTEYRRAGSLREVFGRHLWILAWLVVSIVSLRMVLERSDSNHVLTGVMSSCLFLAVLIAIWLDRGIDRAGLLPKGSAGSVHVWATGCAFLLLLPLLGSPIKALRTLRSYWEVAATSDSRVVKDDYLAAAKALEREVHSSDSFFTMTSEGVWYYLFGVPSCSRFHQLFYARDSVTQREVVESLKLRKPSVILFSNSFWSNMIDGVSVFNSNAPVARYILSSYEPFRNIQGHWFWKYTGRTKSFGTRAAGTVDAFPENVMKARDATFSGHLFPVASGEEVEAVFTSVGSDNILVWAGRNVRESDSALRWEATLPTAALPSGPAIVRFWVLLRPGAVLQPLGDAVRVVLQ